MGLCAQTAFIIRPNREKSDMGDLNDVEGVSRSNTAK